MINILWKLLFAAGPGVISLTQFINLLFSYRKPCCMLLIFKLNIFDRMLGMCRYRSSDQEIPQITFVMLSLKGG